MQGFWDRLLPMRFGLLTLFLLFVLLFWPFIEHQIALEAVAQLLFFTTLLVSLSVGGESPRQRWWLLGLFAVSLGLLSASMVFGPEYHRWTRGPAMFLHALVMVGCIGLIMHYIFRSRKITLDLIFAAVVTYLLIAIFFAQVFSFLFFLEPRNFLIPEHLQSWDVFFIHQEMTYLSLVTLTTLGYGDIVPHFPFAQRLAAVEAVVSQLYLTLLVAALVGIYVSDTVATRIIQAEKKHDNLRLE